MKQLRLPVLATAAFLIFALAACGTGDADKAGSSWGKNIAVWAQVADHETVNWKVRYDDNSEDGPSVRAYNICFRGQCTRQSVGKGIFNTGVKATVPANIDDVKAGGAYTATVDVDVVAGSDAHFTVNGTFREGPAPWE